jgi:hypothetical protein
VRNWTPKKFKTRPKIGIAVASYAEGADSQRRGQALCCLLQSLRAQTYDLWHALVVHDGPLSADTNYALGAVTWDDKCRLHVTETRQQQFGHPHRQTAIDKLLAMGCDWIGLTNDDDYYMPVYFEWMLSAALDKKVDFVYCDMIHSHQLWKPLTCEIRRGRIDVGGFLVHRRIAEQVKFDNYTFAGDWDYISRLHNKAKLSVKVPATLFVHN